jgi:LysM repeat protein
LIVKKGETLAAAARRGNVSVAEIRRLNQLKTDRVAPGTRLALAAPAISKGAPAAPAAKKPRITRYTVKRGDTLQSIARQFKVDQKDLMRWNNTTSAALRPGQQLTIQVAQSG